MHYYMIYEETDGYYCQIAALSSTDTCVSHSSWDRDISNCCSILSKVGVCNLDYYLNRNTLLLSSPQLITQDTHPELFI